MSIWAEVKHAINSTLGKEYFQPLDQIIVGGKQIIADENEINCYIPLITRLHRGRAATPQALASFRTRFAGSFYIEVQGAGEQIRDTNYTNDKYIPYLYVYVNGVAVYSANDWKLYEKGGTNPTAHADFTLPAGTNPNYVLLTDVPANALVEVKYFCDSVHSTNTSYINFTSLYLKGKIQEVFAQAAE